MSRRCAPVLVLALLLALPASAAAHTIPGLVHDARDVVVTQAPGTHASIAADGVHLELRRAGASVVEVLDLQGLPALKLDARGAWARKGAPILSVLSIATGAPDPSNPAWLQAGDSTTSLRFHFPGTHGEVLHHWSVPLRVDGRRVAIDGAVERVPRPSVLWVLGACAAVAGGIGLALLLRARRRVTYILFAGLAVAAVVVPYGESDATSARPWGALVAAAVVLAGLAVALRVRRDPALELGALSVAAILLVLPLVGRLAVLRHGVIVTTLTADQERVLVIAGLALAAGVTTAAARAWWPASAPPPGSPAPARRPG